MSYQYRECHCGDKMAIRLSYLHGGISYTGKMTCFYWTRAHMLKSWNRWVITSHRLKWILIIHPCSESSPGLANFCKRSPSWPLFQGKEHISMYRNFGFNDETVRRPFVFTPGIPILVDRIFILRQPPGFFPWVSRKQSQGAPHILYEVSR